MLVKRAPSAGCGSFEERRFTAYIQTFDSHEAGQEQVRVGEGPHRVESHVWGSIAECICNKSGLDRRCRSHVGVVVSARRQRCNDAQIVASKLKKLALVEKRPEHEGRLAWSSAMWRPGITI